MKLVHAVEEDIAAEKHLVLHDPESSPEAIEEALAWINASPFHRQLFDNVSRFAELSRALGTAGGRRRTRLPRAGRLMWAQIAAVIALTAGVLVFGHMSGLWATSARPTAYAYQTRRGEIRQITLADGSHMTLAGASKVDARMGSVRELRVVNGRAYFEVKRDPRRPFRVRTGPGWVTALGTGFDVGRIEDQVVVTLAHGSVEVTAQSPDGRATESVRLLPGEQVSYDSQGKLDPPHRIDLSAALAWRDGELRFMRRPLGLVVVELNLYSNRRIVIADFDAAHAEVTGIVRIDGIAEWLRGLNRLTDVEVVEYPDKTVIRSKRSHGALDKLKHSSAQISRPSSS
ncbi:MAG TPA: FecR domain-containing protein [Gemmatimonadales bacterium]|nr:FecR domain-containing protein [Gemmatimonadales bacterium]